MFGFRSMSRQIIGIPRGPAELSVKNLADLVLLNIYLILQKMHQHCSP
jgi:hypothetical protein